MVKILLFWILLIPVTCFADELIVGTEAINYPPFIIFAEGSKLGGFYREVLDKFAADNQHSIVYVPYPIKRLMLNLLNGKVDFKIPDNEYWSQDLRKGHVIYYTRPITTYIDGVFVSPENKGLPYENMTSLVTVRGFTPFPFMQEIATGQITFSETISIAAVLEMVANKRSYGGFVNVDVAKNYIKTVMHATDTVTVTYDDQLPKGISKISLSTNSKPQIIEQFNKWMLANQVWLNDLKNRYNIN
jgi:polar amino acid transport system substrate-binding protein